MHSANLTTAKLKGIFLTISALIIYTFASAQENSPYSRYGIGDVVPKANILNRSMGGITTGYAGDQTLTKFINPIINLSNPAAIANLASTTFDVGAEVDIRNLKSNSSPASYKSINTNISYLQFGFPITPARWKAKKNAWGVSFGLKPITRINYKIQNNKRLTGIDSLQTNYEGSGGVNQVNVATGIKIKHVSFGVSTGYSFGNRNYSTKVALVNDSIPYSKSTTESSTNFGGLFVNLGAQYEIKLKKGTLVIGASTNLQQNLNAKKDNLNATFLVNPTDGTALNVDTISFSNNIKGTIKLPASYSAGFTYANEHWLVGADVDYTQWSKYSSYGQKEAVKNNTTVRVGAQYFPAQTSTPAKKYWNFVKYRAGFYYGNDYVQLDKNRPDYALTFGAGFPLTSLQRVSYFGEYVTLNAGVELGQRGTKQNQSIREGFTKISFGITMDAGWFQKRKYN